MSYISFFSDHWIKNGLGKTSIVQNLIKEWEKQGLKKRSSGTNKQKNTKSFDRGLITPHGNHEMEKEIFRLKETIDKSIVIFLEKDGYKDEYLDMVKISWRKVFKEVEKWRRAQD
ncbi:hypothetical protein GLOIN_2v1791704 [Rhizophagus irregularis DAOM 181602=DAOM 197198]|nr:hypothetical protein GLOIN_2v1791704 [Rhizophagus irregularis DAOM 181602=DAOM 197198]